MGRSRLELLVRHAQYRASAKTGVFNQLPVLELIGLHLIDDEQLGKQRTGNYLSRSSFDELAGLVGHDADEVVDDELGDVASGTVGQVEKRLRQFGFCDTECVLFGDGLLLRFFATHLLLLALVLKDLREEVGAVGVDSATVTLALSATF